MFNKDKEFLKSEIEEVGQSLKIISIFKYRNQMPFELIRSLDNKSMHLKSILKKLECLEFFLKDHNIDENTFNETYGIGNEDK